jgi:hypothetical protein
MFKHTGPRSPETDAIAEDYARHVVGHAAALLPAGKLEVTLEWVHHNQPDMWLLFATGIKRKDATP